MFLLFIIIDLFLTPIRYYVIDSSLYIDLFTLIFFVSLINKKKYLTKNKNFNFLFFSLITISLLGIIMSIVDIPLNTTFKIFRVHILMLFYGIVIYNYVIYYNINIIRILNTIIFIISIDALISVIFYYSMYFPHPELLYPWSLINIQEGQHINLLDMPTIFGYPYLHSEVFLFGIVSLYRLSLKWSLWIFLNLILITLVFKVSTVILALLIVLFIYSISKNIMLLPVFISIIVISTISLWNYIEPVLKFYDYFSSSVFIKILGLNNIFMYFQEVSWYQLLFGSHYAYYTSQENGLGTEIGIFTKLIQFGLIWLISFLLFMLYLFFQNYKLFLNTKNQKYLLFSLVPIFILVDSLHYFNFYKVQTLPLIVAIILLIINDDNIKYTNMKIDKDI